ACLYRKAFGARPPADPERALVHVGKSLAAFLETLRSGRTAFDDFRDALARGDIAAAERYPEFARKGARIFVGSGRCHLCHDGRYATLDDVVRHYSDLDMERIHTHGEQLLRPLKLSSTASVYMVAFLESLTSADTTRVPPPPFVAGCGGG